MLSYILPYGNFLPSPPLISLIISPPLNLCRRDVTLHPLFYLRRIRFSLCSCNNRRSHLTTRDQSYQSLRLCLVIWTLTSNGLNPYNQSYDMSLIYQSVNAFSYIPWIYIPSDLDLYNGNFLLWTQSIPSESSVLCGKSLQSDLFQETSYRVLYW